MRSLTQMTRRFVAAALIVAGVGFVAVPAAQPASAYTTISYNGAGPNAARIGLIGDSSFAGVRWLNSYAPLKRYNFVLDAESCRRTLAASCRGREGYAPANALTTLRRLNGTFDDVLVMVTGYNDPGVTFAEAVDRVMAEAIRQGIDHVVWLTMRTAAVTYVSPGYRSNTYTFRDNNRILLQKAHLYEGRLHIADWATYSTPPQGWVTPDGVHLTRTGTVAVTDFIADQVAMVLAGQRITPAFEAPPLCRVGVDLRPGDNLLEVRCLEISLRNRGLFGATPDTVYDATTAAAVNRINALQGWTQDGIADVGVRQTLGAWRAPLPRPFCASSRTLRAGAAGDDVTCLSRRLWAHGYLLPVGPTFGARLQAAVLHFQRSVGMAATGIADTATLIRLGVHRPACRVSGGLLPGMESAAVHCLRQFLHGLGRVTPTNTSQYDLVVTNHVRAIEQWRGLPIDGIADVRFMRTIGALVKPPPVVAPATPPSSTVPEATPSATPAPATTGPPPTTTVGETVVATTISPVPTSSG